MTTNCIRCLRAATARDVFHPSLVSRLLLHRVRRDGSYSPSNRPSRTARTASNEQSMDWSSIHLDDSSQRGRQPTTMTIPDDAGTFRKAESSARGKFLPGCVSLNTLASIMLLLARTLFSGLLEILDGLIHLVIHFPFSTCIAPVLQKSVNRLGDFFA